MQTDKTKAVALENLVKLITFPVKLLRKLWLQKVDTFFFFSLTHLAAVAAVILRLNESKLFVRKLLPCIYTRAIFLKRNASNLRTWNGREVKLENIFIVASGAAAFI